MPATARTPRFRRVVGHDGLGPHWARELLPFRVEEAIVSRSLRPRG